MPGKVETLTIAVKDQDEALQQRPVPGGQASRYANSLVN
jgi:hypothetical protein